MKDRNIKGDLLCVIIAAVLLLNSTSDAAPLTLSAKGASNYQIVIATNAIPSERYAAEELQRYLEKITGGKFPMITDGEAIRGREILLGDNGHLRKLGLKIDCGQLGQESFILRTDHNRLI
ncbi:MAG TPA: hypothetical protein VL361_05310, partial [Candidatus Limnocylindrales bacterium]|nr:hypothetical protein [Candidatus Limnocylindrales bacterium]